MEITHISKESSQYTHVLDLLRQFDIHGAENIEFVDSSHGEDDIRHNYIIDKKYVLRINSAKVIPLFSLIIQQLAVKSYC